MPSASSLTESPPESAEIAYLTGRESIPHLTWLYDFIEPALRRDTLTAEDVLEQITLGAAIAWIVEEDNEVSAVAVTREDRGVLEIMTLGGKGFMDWSDDLQAAFEDHCRINKLSGMRAYCRPGMAKRLRALGWKKHQEVMTHGW